MNGGETPTNSEYGVPSQEFFNEFLRSTSLINHNQGET